MAELTEMVAKLKKDIETVVEWHKAAKPLSKEQRIFCEQVTDRMLAMKMANKAGVQIISKAHMKFIKSIDAGSRTEDAVASGQADKGEPMRVSAGVDDVVKADVPKKKSAELPKPSPKQAESQLQASKDLKAAHNPPIAEGEVNAVADKEATPEMKAPAEEIGHNPDEPMPKKTAEEVIENVAWGIEIGAYQNVEEGLGRQLERKDYSEFVDTPEKMAAVIAYLKTVAAQKTAA